jgi:hypothetical protein
VLKWIWGDSTFLAINFWENKFTKLSKSSDTCTRTPSIWKVGV